MVLYCTTEITIIVFLASFFLSIYFYVIWKYTYWSRKRVPFFKPFPILGNFKECFLFKTSIGEHLQVMYNETKEDVMGFYVFLRPFLLVKNPELIKQILVKDFNYFCDRSIANNEKSDPISSHSLFLVKNPQWKYSRAKVGPIFTATKLKMMFQLMNEVGKNLTKYLHKLCQKNENSLDAKEITSKYSINVISTCAFGIDAHCFEHENSEFRVIGRKFVDFNFSRAVQILSYFFIPFAVKWFGFTFMDRFSINYMKKVFLSTLEARRKSKFKRNDLIDILLELNKTEMVENGAPMETNKIVAQAVQFFFAGYETTSSTISATLYELCLQPDIQQRLRNEIQTTIPKSEELTYDTVKDLKYLNMVVSETLRMYPTLPFLDRVAQEDYTLPGSEVVVEKGTAIYIPLFGLHFDPEHFPEPQKFDPERFNDENIRNIVPYTYLPFGTGPRNCIGERFGLMTTKLALIHILSNFSVERSVETPVPLKLNPKAFLITSTVGFPMKFKELNSNLETTF